MTGTIFIAAFLGALFALSTALPIVYTYMTLRLGPRLKRELLEFVEGGALQAILEHEALQQLDATPVDVAVNEPPVRVIFTCEDHGRCVGCPKILAQFEAIIRHQGSESFDEVERKCYARLRDQLESDARIEGESEAARQKRIAARVIEALVNDGLSRRAAHSTVWSRCKEDRATFATWLSAARPDNKLPSQHEDAT